MRILAFSLFVCAAFNWALPWVDRLGTAALGFGCMALAMGLTREPRRSFAPFSRTRAAEDATHGQTSGMSDLTDRLAAYALDDPAGVGVPRPDLTH